METHMPLVLTREELYELVWSIPIRTLAKRFGISDQGLAKKCKKHSIPRPPLGHWQKQEAGKPVKRPPLSPIADPDLARVAFREPSESIKEAVLIATDDPRLLLARGFNMPKRIVHEHPLVAETRSAFRPNNTDNYGFIMQPYKPGRYLDIKTSPTSLSRALRLFQSWITLFAKLGWEVTVKPRGEARHAQTFVHIDGEPLKIRLKEKVRQVPHVLTAKETADKAKWGRVFAKAYDYEPTGLLSLGIDEYCSENVRLSWSDGRVLLEDQCEAIVKGLLIVREEVRRRRLRQEEDRRRREEEQLRFEEMQRRKAEAKKRVDALVTIADQWHRSVRLNAFLDEVERRLALSQSPNIVDQQVQLRWAREQVVQLDPLRDLDNFKL